MAAIVVVPYALAESMLSLGRNVVNDQYMEIFVSRELGNIGVVVDLVEPPPEVAVGRWFIEVDNGWWSLSNSTQPAAESKCSLILLQGNNGIALLGLLLAVLFVNMFY